MSSDPREGLRVSLLENWNLELRPRGDNLDVAEIVTDRGVCAAPVTVRLPLEWVSKFAKSEGIDYLAVLIAEAVDTDTTTQLEEIVVTHDWLRRPVVKLIRT
ncbi:MAG: hypothetical protein Q4G35_00680 [Propionibacteriaceae bacterium]|nr:hypothetical protein [Propionibacteriaceae bacterium]